MKIKSLGANRTELQVGENVILFSYSTPVACRGPAGNYRTAERHSVTTSKHIAQWGAKGFETRPQDWFTALTEGGAK